MTRKAISKKDRFEVFKRDGFKCIYCGQSPPNVLLEVDHIMPVSKGGQNNQENLITACFDCNRGKRNKLLSEIPLTLKERVKIENEKILQYKDYLKTVNNKIKVKNKAIDMVQNIYTSNFEGYIFSDRFRGSVKRFIESLGIEEVQESMETACFYIHDENEVLTYFCGICWNKIKAR